MASKPAYPQLQRHRRKSSQPSPTSPTFPRRTLDRPPRIIDPFSPVDSISATTAASESPSFDPSAPSPASQAHEFSQPKQDAVKRYPIRLSEEDGRPRPAMLGDIERPLTSGAIETKNSFGYSPNTAHIGPGNRASPILNSGRFASYDRTSQESGRFPQSLSPNLNYYNAATQPAERGLSEEQAASKAAAGKKSRLNLLNPMSLLARRRSSQHQNDPGALSINTMHVPALRDDFEPSIRGTITHDFSAPRTRRTPSYDYSNHLEPSSNRDPHQSSEKGNPRLQPPSGPTSHSPMFKEHFQDDRPAFRPGQTSSLHNIATQGLSVDQLEASMPAFAKKLPLRLPDQAPLAPKAPPPPPPTDSTTDLDRPLPEEPSEPPPPPPPKRTPSPKLNMPPASLLPKHMTSTSSRFSFQLGGQASSAQEKLLEERHKQFQYTKRVSSLSKAENADEPDYDNYDFDAEGIEEDIPEISYDYDENEDFGDEGADAVDRSRIEHMTSLQQQSLQGFHFTPQSLTFSPTSTNHASQPTPRDTEGFAIGVADSMDLSEHKKLIEERSTSAMSDESAQLAFLGGLGITTKKPAAVEQTVQNPPPPKKSLQTFDDADLYFDDGEFGDEFQQTSNETFDEDVFDDESKIRDIPAENARKFEAAMQAAGSNGQIKRNQSQPSSMSTNSGPHSNGLAASGGEVNGISRSISLDQKQSSRPGLTEGNLEAYHNALAKAANDAAATGRFSRNVTFDDSEDESQPGLISDESRFSNNYGGSGIAEDDGFPFDDDGDDDLMIAEANAEALENDDEGFYGQEFGFYARAHTKESSEMVNGGFFASRGSNGIKRSHSGRANFQEPSLTPITERSEWSARNSVASLPIPGGNPLSAHSLPSPSITQLLELDSPVLDEDMTLSALMKIRRGAFGGSSTSINSVGQGHAGSSPLAHTGPHPFSPQDYGHNRLGSSIHSLTTTSAGIPESEEEEEFNQIESTLTQNTPTKKPPDSESNQEHAVLSPTSDHSERRKFSHSRNSSGAESVSYARESDGRWVLERRRTGEDGGIEVDREYLAGAHI